MGLLLKLETVVQLVFIYIALVLFFSPKLTVNFLLFPPFIVTEVLNVTVKDVILLIIVFYTLSQGFYFCSVLKCIISCITCCTLNNVHR